MSDKSFSELGFEDFREMQKSFYKKGRNLHWIVNELPKIIREAYPKLTVLESKACALILPDLYRASETIDGCYRTIESRKNELNRLQTSKD